MENVVKNNTVGTGRDLSGGGDQSINNGQNNIQSQQPSSDGSRSITINAQYESSKRPKAVKSIMAAGAAVFETVQTIMISLAITGFIYLFLAIPNQVEGSSMEPSFYDNNLLITNKLIQIVNHLGFGEQLGYEYERGDVVIFQKPGNPDFIKRVIAKEGDTISIEDQKVFVNGKELEEHYLDPDARTFTANDARGFIDEGETLTVPENKFFVMGDNREHSQDSRYSTVGWVDIEEIKGRVFLRYFPLQDFGIIGRGEYVEIDNFGSE